MSATTRAALLILILAPLVGEVLSTSTELAIFAGRPGIFLVYLGFYGCGALLIREFAARRGLGYASILFMGAAYGALEEGFILKSWFDPDWMLAAVSSEALRVAGVNALQPFMNVAYHATISIIAPIMLVDAFTGLKGQPLLGRRGWIGAAVVFLVAALALTRFNADYAVEPWHRLVAIAVVAVFVAAGLKAWHFKGSKERSPLALWLAGVVFVVGMFAVGTGMAPRGVHWIVILISFGIVYGLYAWFIATTAWTHRWQYFSAGAGIVSGLLPVALVGTVAEPLKFANTILTVLFTAGLVILYRRRIRQPSATGQRGAS
ncbi:MAG: hypothetical protein ACOC5K_01635 [Chloroflexota bacterium]